MEENYLKDINEPVRKRSIKDIPIPNHRNTRRKTSNTISLRKPERKEEEIFQTHDVGKVSGGNFKKIIIGLGAVILIVIIFVTMSIFSKAIIDIVPKSENISNLDVTIPVVSAANNVNNDLLTYKTLDINKNVSLEYNSDKEESVEANASGIITIYNEYSENSQKLIQNTRFESPEGLIYRIKDSVNVPGYKMVSGEKVPGSIDVTVYADEPGEKYNGLQTDFTIPGFRGSEQFDFFYAKAKTEFTGGFVGVRRNLNEDNLEIAKNELEQKLKDEVIKEVDEKITEEYYYTYNQDSFNFGQVVVENSDKNNKVNAKLSGTGFILILNKNDIAKKIAEKQLGNYGGDNVYIKNFSELEINTISDGDNFSINIKGNPEIIWQIDKDAIKKDLLGIKKNEINSVLAKYNAISKVKAKTVPFNFGDISTNPDKIKINVEN